MWTKKIIAKTIIRGDNKFVGSLLLDVQFIFYPLLNDKQITLKTQEIFLFFCLPKKRTFIKKN